MRGVSAVRIFSRIYLARCHHNTRGEMSRPIQDFHGRISAHFISRGGCSEPAPMAPRGEIRHDLILSGMVYVMVSFLVC